jgi:bHLH-MYC and R2R3-MYB transcription factors N-terminal
LQEKFLLSVTNEASQLELRFHLSKTWRMQFANLCSQLSCKILDDKAWLSSLEQMEIRATEAEETIRRARRRRMGLALKADAMTVSDGVFFAGMSFHRQVSELALASRNEGESTEKTSGNTGGVGEVYDVDTQIRTVTRPPPQRVSSASLNNSTGGNLSRTADGDSIISNHSSSIDDVHINTMLELAAPEHHYKSSTSKFNGGGGGQSVNVGFKMNSSADSLHEFAEIFDDLMEDSSQHSHRCSRGTLGSQGGSFLDSMIEFVEVNNLPFQHVDVWVPSLNPAVTGGGEGSGAATTANSSNNDTNPAHASIRLCHAGHATRSDLDPSLSCQLYEYGEYSIKYSFAPGSGLPGRAFTSFQSIWDCRIDEANVKYFERAGGAKIYGVKTAVGIPLQSKTTGCIIIAFYSVNDIPRDEKMMEQLQHELARLRPEPKWKLVVDNTGDLPISNKSLSRLSSAGIGVIEPGFSSMMQQSNVTTNENNRAQVQQQQASASTRHEEIEIARILGECMPLANDNFNSGSNSMSDLDLYVSLRLLLLRPSDRRTVDENVVVEIILKSYEGYTSVSSRWNSTMDLASLIVKDWSYLRTSILPSFTSTTPPMQAQVQGGGQLQQQQNFSQPQNQTHGGQQMQRGDPSPVVQRMSITNGMSHGTHTSPLTNHQCHVMELPKISTFATSGAPVRMPPFFLGSTTSNNNNTGTKQIPYLRDRSTSYPPNTSHNNLSSLALPNNLRLPQQQMSLSGQQQQQQQHGMYTTSNTTPNVSSANYHDVDDGCV